MTNEEYYSTHVHGAISKLVLNELNERFGDDLTAVMEKAAAFGFDSKDELSDFNEQSLRELAAYYSIDFSSGNLASLDIELKSFSHVIKEALFQEKVKDVHALLKWLHEANAGDFPLYPQLYKLLSLIVVLPITSASAERTFSTLKIIKNRLRSKREIPGSWI